jgi:hypothetical protein
MTHHDDFAFEPIRGLPAELPAGERLLWQGEPDWKALARNAFHVVKVAIYFAVLAVWLAVSALYDGAGLAAAATRVSWLVLVGGAACGILAALAWFYARSTVYSLTSKRIVIRSGLAIPVTINLPFAKIETASLGLVSGETGNVAITIVKPDRIAFLLLWPNARPFQFAHPQPMLRCIPDARRVAGLLGEALAAEAGQSEPVGKRQRAGAVRADPASAMPGIGAVA